MQSVSSKILTERPTVFVLAPAFHGATVLSIYLDSHPEIVSLGDTVPRWNQNCACGSRVIDCKFWQKIIKATTNGQPSDKTRHIISPLKINESFKALDYFIVSGLYAISRISPEFARKIQGENIHRFLAKNEIFVDTALSAMNKSILVDGQKSISKALLMVASNSRSPRRIIHLIRDPRAYVTSSLKGKNPGTENIVRTWKRLHLGIEIFGRTLKNFEYLPIKFEDFARNPQKTMDQISLFLNLDPMIVEGKNSQVRLGHQIGNTSYRKHGVSVNSSEGWREALTLAQQQKILQLAGRLGKKYGYYLK
jgi:hypothetical protein